MTNPLVPDGIRHTPDLSELAVADRRKHHTKQISSIALHQGLEGVAEYKRRHPEAAAIRVTSTPLAYHPKPRGYADRLAGMVDEWFRSDAALYATNRADVSRLNTEFPAASFNPDNHFSKPLSPTVLRKLGDVFSRHGAHLDAGRVNTASKVREAIKAFKAGDQSNARPFGRVGSIAGDTLTLGTATFRIETHKGRECVRVASEGARQRVYLSSLQALLAGLPGDDPLPSSYSIRMGDVVPSAVDPLEAATESPVGANSPGELQASPEPLLMGDVVPEPVSLSARIARLSAARRPTPDEPRDPNIDPLEL